MVINNIDFPLGEIAEGDSISFADFLTKDEVRWLFERLLSLEISRGKSFKYELKNLNVEVVAEIVRIAMSHDKCVNPSIVANILVLIRNYNSLDDSFFESKNIFVSSLEGLLDLKLNLKQDIRDFNRKLSILFLSCLKSASKFEYNFTEDKPVEVSPLMRTILFNMDAFLLSSMLSNCETFSSEDFYPVANALTYVAEFASKISSMDALFNAIYGGPNG